MNESSGSWRFVNRYLFVVFLVANSWKELKCLEEQSGELGPTGQKNLVPTQAMINTWYLFWQGIQQGCFPFLWFGFGHRKNSVALFSMTRNIITTLSLKSAASLWVQGPRLFDFARGWFGPWEIPPAKWSHSTLEAQCIYFRTCKQNFDVTAPASS